MLWLTRMFHPARSSVVSLADCSARALLLARRGRGVALLQWQTRPQTDDATVRANFIGIAPQVSGHIAELRCATTSRQRKASFFLIDPRPYEIALEQARARWPSPVKRSMAWSSAAAAVAGVSKAEAQLAPPRRRSPAKIEPVVADAKIARLEAQRVSAEATLRTAEAQFQNVEEHVQRLEPLLPQQFVTADQRGRSPHQADLGRHKRGTGAHFGPGFLAALDEAKARSAGRSPPGGHPRPTSWHGGGAATRPAASGLVPRVTSARLDGINARVAAAEAAVHRLS